MARPESGQVHEKSFSSSGIDVWDALANEMQHSTFGMKADLMQCKVVASILTRLQDIPQTHSALHKRQGLQRRIVVELLQLARPLIGLDGRNDFEARLISDQEDASGQSDCIGSLEDVDVLMAAVLKDMCADHLIRQANAQKLIAMPLPPPTPQFHSLDECRSGMNSIPEMVPEMDDVPLPKWVNWSPSRNSDGVWASKGIQRRSEVPLPERLNWTTSRSSSGALPSFEPKTIIWYKDGREISWTRLRTTHQKGQTSPSDKTNRSSVALPNKRVERARRTERISRPLRAGYVYR